MKKAALFLLLLGFLLQTSSAVEIKALLGMNSSKYQFPSAGNALDTRARQGMSAGIGCATDLNAKIKLEINAMYKDQGVKTTLQYSPDNPVDGIYVIRSIAVPLFFKYRLKENASPYAALGPECVFVISHRLELPGQGENFDLSDNTKKFMFGYNAVLGYELPLGRWALLAEFRYNRWLGSFLADTQAAVKMESLGFILGGVIRL
ncbi:MAG: outer membrane beta-barrel protein [Candidatus Aminicenantes bacterium]|nr:outer membrane beta-barrel protein [Candidatus Aminicenantes bacterium]